MPHDLPSPALTDTARWLVRGLGLEHNSPDLHLLTMATGVLLSLFTCKTELVARRVYGAGKTQCIAILAAYFALRGHHVYYGLPL